jgi:hypothetical protein
MSKPSAGVTRTIAAGCRSHHASLQAHLQDARLMQPQQPVGKQIFWSAFGPHCSLLRESEGSETCGSAQQLGLCYASLVYQVGHCSTHAVHSCLEGAEFESVLRHHLSWLRFFVIFLFRLMAGQYLLYAVTAPFQILSNLSCIYQSTQWCAVWLWKVAWVTRERTVWSNWDKVKLNAWGRTILRKLYGVVIEKVLWNIELTTKWGNYIKPLIW